MNDPGRKRGWGQGWGAGRVAACPGVLAAVVLLSGSLLAGAMVAGCKSTGQLTADSEALSGLSPDEARFLRMASRGERGQVAELLDQGVDINVRDASGRTALFFAAAGGHKELTSFLLSRGIEKAPVDIVTRWTPLHAASSSGHEETVSVLLGYGVPTDPQDAEGNTPLHLAALRGHQECTRLLLERGADPTVRNNESKTPVEVADPRRTRHLFRAPAAGGAS